MSNAIERAKNHSEAKLHDIRIRLNVHTPKEATVITFGSYARREASNESDIDYIVVGEAPADKPEWMKEVERAISDVVPLEPSADGAFARYVCRADLLRNLGGPHDTNQSLTWRLLTLLEGEWLANVDGFRSIRRELIDRYVAATTRDHQLALFLLNDVIRYWRTMTVDYMYKTEETGKPWAIRNIKLVFSRKLMYASGLFSVGVTLDRGERAKADKLDELFALPPIHRMQAICGVARFENALKSYSFFLEKMESQEVRSALKAIERGNHQDPVFRELKNEGHTFTRELLVAFEGTFHATHPIRRAVIF